MSEDLNDKATTIRERLRSLEQRCRELREILPKPGSETDNPVLVMRTEWEIEGIEETISELKLQHPELSSDET